MKCTFVRKKDLYNCKCLLKMINIVTIIVNLIDVNRNMLNIKKQVRSSV